MPSELPEFDAFIAALRPRLYVGAQTYGDASFERALPETADEIMQELLDVAGWAWIAWVRLKRVRDRINELEGE